MSLVSEVLWPVWNFVKYFFFEITKILPYWYLPFIIEIQYLFFCLCKRGHCFFKNLILLNNFARFFVMLSQVRHYDLCSSDNFRLSPMYTHHAVCIDFWLEIQTLSSSLRCHVTLFTDTQYSCLILTWRSFLFKWASCFMYHLLLRNTMITPVEILCITLPHSPRTRYSNST